MDKCKITKSEYINGNFTPYVNWASAIPKKGLQTKYGIIPPEVFIFALTARNEKVMRNYYGSADFSEDWEYRTYAWAFKWKEWRLIYFSSGKGGSVEIEHSAGVSPFEKDAKKYAKEVGPLLSAWIEHIIECMCKMPISEKSHCLKVDKKCRMSYCDSIDKGDRFVLVDKRNEIEIASFEEAVKEGYFPIRV